MNSLKHIVLLFTVFITGASSLIVEVVGLRLLSPFYGNTIFTVSSVISVILLALSCGYYLGGKLADRRATLDDFFGLIFISGLVLLCFYSLGAVALPYLSSRLSIAVGPLVSAMLLFFPGAMLLGTLGPYAVKLRIMRLGQHAVGSAAGSIFFWSTLGSISGSLCAGFVLIPRFGVDRILIANGAVLSALGLVPLLILGATKKRTALSVIAFAFFCSAAIWARGQAPRQTLYLKDGIYQKIAIYDGEYVGRPTRFFQQDQNSAGAGEGAMFLDSDDPTDLVYDYTRYYSLYKVFTPRVENALVIGGGAYSVPKALLQELPQANIDTVDIEPALFSLGQQFFKVPDNPRLHNYVEDGRRFLAKSSKRYDLIFSDVYYSFFSVPPHFGTREFFAVAKDRLSPNGIFIANMIGDLSRQQRSLIMSEIKTFQTVFPNSYIFAVSWPEKTDSQNIMLVGYNSSEHIDLNSPAILANRDPLVRTVYSKLLDVGRRFELSRYPILTDNYSPIEYLTAQALRRALEESKSIDGDEMLADVAQQVRYGPRYPGTPGHVKMKDFLVAEMGLLAREVTEQTWEQPGAEGQSYKLSNIIGHFYSGQRRVLLATHYNSNPAIGIQPAALDSGAADASGVAVLVELARAFGDSNVPPRFGIDLVFFDDAGARQEDGQRAVNDASIGATYFARHLNDFYGDDKPVVAIVLNAACGSNLRVLKEPSSVRSAAAQVDAFWKAGQQVDQRVFSNQVGPEVEGDQKALIAAGIPSVLVGNATSLQPGGSGARSGDCSPQSLETIGRAIMNYVMPPADSSDR